MTPEQKAALQRAAIRSAQRRANDPLAALRGSPADLAATPPASTGGGMDFLDPIQGDPTRTSAVLDNVVGGYLPEMSPGEKAGTLLNKAGESMTFGIAGDEASAAVSGAIPGGMGYDERLAFERENERAMEESNPGAMLGAELGGAVVGALLPGGAVGTLGRGAGLGSRIAASTAAGAGMGGAYGFMEGEGASDRLEGAKTGGTIGGVVGALAPVVGAGVQRVADARAGSRAIQQAAQGAPSAEQLRAAGNRLYDQIDNAGVQINAPSFERAQRDISQRLLDSTAYSVRPGGRTITPNTSAVMDDMGAMVGEMAGQPGAAIPFREVDHLRRQAGAAAGNVTNRSDQQAGMTIIEGLDDFVRNLGPDDIAAGDVEALKSALPKARDIWSRMSKSQLIEDAMAQEGNYLSGGASAIRNRVASILRNKKLSRGFTEAEKKAMQRVVSGSIPQQIVNYMGSGLGMMGQIGLGVSAGPVGAIAGLAGAAGSRALSEAMTRKNAEVVRALVANGRLNTLPVATDSSRRVVEALMRRGGAVGPQ